jgi:hypothetical protein
VYDESRLFMLNFAIGVLLCMLLVCLIIICYLFASLFSFYTLGLQLGKFEPTLRQIGNF